MKENKKFIDTNLIIYYVEQNEEFYPQVKEIFERVERGEIQLITSSVSYAEATVNTKDKTLTKAKYDYLFRGSTDSKSLNISIDVNHIIGEEVYLLKEIPILTVVEIDFEIGCISAKIRDKYKIDTPDTL